MTTEIETKADLKEALLHQLSLGRENAVKGNVLAKRLDFKDDRFIRQTIRELIAEGSPIASSTGKPAGYFIANSPDEAIDFMRDLKGRLVNDAYRRRDFKRAARKLLQPSQLYLL